MKQRKLGTSGLQVSALALGAMTFGAETDEAEAHRMIGRFLEAGGNLIDTADVYARGASEEIVGRWMARHGDEHDVIVATKGRMPMGDRPNQGGTSRRYLVKAVDASLRRLQVEAIDLYQLHGWDPHTPVEEALGALDDLVTAGKIRYVGVSNLAGWQFQQFLLVARYEDLSPVISLQAQYSLLSREIEWELLPACLDQGIGLLPWSPLGGGWLTGKYRRDEAPSGATRLGEDPTRGVEAYALRNTERTWDVLDAVERIAGARSVPMSQVALAWLLGRPNVDSVILGARTELQLAENLGSVAWELSDEERTALDRVSAPGLPLYPYAFLERYCGETVYEELVTRIEPPAIGG